MDRRSFLLRSGQSLAWLTLGPRALFAQAQTPVTDIAALYRESIVIDGLCAPTTSDQFPPSASDLGQVARSGVTAINFTVSQPDFEGTVARIAFAEALAEAYPERFLVVRQHSDIARAKRGNKTGIMLGFQYTQPFEADLERIQTFRRLGVRIMQLTYNNRGLLGDGCLEPGNAGLSKAGRAAIARMNELGVAMDLSHCGQRTTAEAIEASAQPVLITHTGCSAVHAHPRNKGDCELRALADRGGVAGIYLMPYLSPSPVVPARQHVLEHLKHALDICGSDHVGLGSDQSIPAFPDTPEQRRTFEQDMQHRKQVGIAAPEEDRMPFVPDLNTPMKIEEIAQGLQRQGQPSSVIQKVIGGNFQRVLGEIWSRG